MKTDEPLDRLLERASRPRDGGNEPEGCLDAETLAAWADGSLSVAQRAAAEAHAADCERCLAVLAAIAKTTPPPAVAAGPSWLAVRWLVPLTTAAVAVAVWVLVQPPSEDPRVPAPAPVREAAKPSELPVESGRVAAPNARADEVDRIDVAPGATRDTNRAEPERRTALDPKAPTDLADKPRATPPPADARLSRPTPTAAATPAAPVVARPEAKDERAQMQAGAFAAPPRLIPSPDSQIQWRIAGTSIQRSTDGGGSWITQTTATGGELLAGFAPAPKVCWIVGRRGLVLLTTDGETWRRVDIPDAEADLVEVIGRDGTAATVTTADGRRFQTTDAGRTWTLQEDSSAPF